MCIRIAYKSVDLNSIRVTIALDVRISYSYLYKSYKGGHIPLPVIPEMMFGNVY